MAHGDWGHGFSLGVARKGGPMHQPTMGRRTFVKGSLAASALAALAACGKKGGSDTTATSGEATGGTLN